MATLMKVVFTHNMYPHDQISVSDAPLLASYNWVYRMMMEISMLGMKPPLTRNSASVLCWGWVALIELRTIMFLVCDNHTFYGWDSVRVCADTAWLWSGWWGILPLVFIGIVATSMHRHNPILPTLISNTVEQ